MTNSQPKIVFVTEYTGVLFTQCPDNPQCVITKDGQHIVIDPYGEANDKS